METRARPTSRGRARCVSVRMGRRWEQTAAGPRAGACRLRRVGRRCLAPVGKGRCRCACSTLFALRAKALQSGAPDLGVSREKSRVSERFAHQGTFPARRGTGKRTSPRKERSFSRTPSPLRSHNEPLPTRNGDTRHLTVKTRPSSRKTFHIYPSMANAARFKPRLIASRISRRTSSAPKPSVPRPQKAISPPFPSPPHPPNHPAGRTAGSARTRSRVQTLENPILGSGSRFPAALHPPTPQAAGPCSWACRRLLPPPPHSERNEARPPPARGAGVRRIRANGTVSRHRRPAGGTASARGPCRRVRALPPEQKRNEASPCPLLVGHGLA